MNQTDPPARITHPPEDGHTFRIGAGIEASEGGE